MSVILRYHDRETIEFYFYHLENFSFTWSYDPLEFSYTITLSANKKTLAEKISMPKDTRLKLAVDDSRMMCGHLRNGTYRLRSILSEYPRFIEKKFNIKKPLDVINLESLASTDREKIRRDFIYVADHKIFYSTTRLFKHTVVMTHGNNEVNYSGYAFYNTIIVSKCHHQLADKNFLKYFNFKQTILVVEGTYCKKIGYVYRKKDSSDTPKALVKKEDLFVPKKLSYDLGFSVDGFKFTFLKSQGGLQELLIPSSELINKTEAETKGFASKDIFKLPQEMLVKTAIDNYIKKLTINCINESYFL